MPIHYSQRNRMQTIDIIKKLIDNNEGISNDKEALIRLCIREIGCTRERAEIYIKEAMYQ